MATRTLLGLDTSTLSLSLAVVRLEGEQVRTLARRDREPGVNHSKLLPLLIEEALEEAGVQRTDLDGICVGLGPGAFTGLRIALSVGKGLAYALRVPLVGASTLEAMALAASRLAPEARAVIPLLDARKQEVYVGFYRPSGTGVEPLGEGPADRVMPPEAVAEALASVDGPILLLGEGYFAYRTLFDEATEGKRLDGIECLPETPPSVEIAELAGRALPAYTAEAVFALEPHYVRASEVELKAKQKKEAP